MGIVLILEIIITLILSVALIGYLLIAIIPRSIKLLKIRIKEADKRINEYEKNVRREITQNNQDWGWNAHTQQNRRKISNHQQGTKWTTEGWYWDEEKQLWIAPDYLKAEANRKWEWDEEKRIWIDRDQKHRMERYNEYHSRADREPTFEEWKAAQSKNYSEPYRYTKSDLTKDETKIYTQQTTNNDRAEEPKQTKPVQETQQATPKESPKKSEFENAYEPTPILTQNELRNYRTLNEAAMRRGYVVNTKVRLADIVKPRNDSKYMSHFGKIKSKHVDFVVLDSYMRVKIIIELDDSSHDRKDRKERDEFVDTILKDCGYKIIHTRHITPDILDNI